MNKKFRSRILKAAFFLLVTGLTFYTVFRNQDIDELLSDIFSLSPGWLLLAMISAVLYVCCEGFMIWYMIVGKKVAGGLLRCFGYSFVGFFYSGITPSASGGQPMQLYHLKRDGYSFSRSCAILTVIAAMNKFVLASIGILMLFFWHDTLVREFRGYIGWYYIGLIIVIFWVVLLALFMFVPNLVQHLTLRLVKGLEKFSILKPSPAREEQIIHFFDGYRNVVDLLKSSAVKTGGIVVISYLQRFCLVLIPFLLYRGFGLSGVSILHVLLIQVAAQASVDMLPVPGAQGISELMYYQVFEGIFSSAYLMPAICVTRFVNFYFLLLIGLAVSVVMALRERRTTSHD